MSASVWPESSIASRIVDAANTAAHGEVAPSNHEYRTVSWAGADMSRGCTRHLLAGAIHAPLIRIGKPSLAAHRTLPFGTVVRVRNRQTHQVAVVRINDRVRSFEVASSTCCPAAGRALGLSGLAEVSLEIVNSDP